MTIRAEITWKRPNAILIFQLRENRSPNSLSRFLARGPNRGVGQRGKLSFEGSALGFQAGGSDIEWART